MEGKAASAIELVKYGPESEQVWNELVARSRNGSFLHDRRYMDYHADRFQDCSFLVLKKNRVEAVIPGNLAAGTYCSHQGLTCGGVLCSENISAVDMLDVFTVLHAHLREAGASSVIYKPVPWFYHRIPAEEDLYALFRNGAKLVSRQISSAIIQQAKIPFIESRKSGIRKALRNGVQIQESEGYAPFWGILDEVLMSRHGTKPVHSLEEIERLHRRFPARIRLHVAVIENEVVAGTVMYVTDRVAHVQYIAASEQGKRVGALDLIFDQLINGTYASWPVFEFGVSTEQGGAVLNDALIFQKEGFGGRGVVYDAYEYAL